LLLVTVPAGRLIVVVGTVTVKVVVKTLDVRPSGFVKETDWVPATAFVVTVTWAMTAVVLIQVTELTVMPPPKETAAVDIMTFHPSKFVPLRTTSEEAWTPRLKGLWS